MILGLLCALGAGGLSLYNYLDSLRAGKASADIMEQLADVIGDNLDESNAKDGGTSRKSRTADGKLLTKMMADPTKTPYRDMPTEMIDGYAYIGFLEIPSLSLSLPVMADWDYERLKISPCRYEGSYYTDDLVICGHNYARHFSPVKWIEMGVDVYFTNVEGESIHYVTSNIQTVQPTSVADMIGNNNNGESQNDWDMTLFTCNTGGQTRCAVRCSRVR